MPIKLFDYNDHYDGVVVTPWTLVHYLAGCAAKQTGLFKFLSWFVVHGMYEVKDLVLYPMVRSAVNSAGDQTAAMLGFYFTKLNPNKLFISLYLISLVVGIMFNVESESPESRFRTFRAEQSKTWQEILWERRQAYRQRNAAAVQRSRGQASREGEDSVVMSRLASTGRWELEDGSSIGPKIF